MTKVLIVDDEPLAQIGIESMLNWKSYGITVCGKAMNGAEAYKLIEQYSPEIVITDIKMPVMDGMELVKKCHKERGKLPLFIILTCYEEFRLVKEAISYQVVDYLIKLELNKDILGESITKALSALKEIKSAEGFMESTGQPLLQSFYDKFFIRLLHNLFETTEQFELQARDLNLSFTYAAYTVAHCEIHIPEEADTQEQQINLYYSTLQMIREIISKQVQCYIIPLDIRRFAIIFCFDHDTPTDMKHSEGILAKTSEMIKLYFKASIYASLGRCCTQPLEISDSYQDARVLFLKTSPDCPILSREENNMPANEKNVFNLSVFKNNFTRAFEELDTDILYDTFTEIIELFRNHPGYYLQAIDAACNTLYLAISLLPNGDETVSEIFFQEPEGYRSIYAKRTILQVIEWMTLLRDGLCEKLNNTRKHMRHHVVTNVQKYIRNHVGEKLTLNDVAAVFGISPNYLSMLFKKYSELGFTDYINQCKINKAKELIENNNLKIYEIADQLGFDNAFYFSKVFKKQEGCSPKEYWQRLT